MNAPLVNRLPFNNSKSKNKKNGALNVNKKSKPINKKNKNSNNLALEINKKELQRKAGWAKYYECENHLAKVLGDVYSLKQKLNDQFPKSLKDNLDGAMKLIVRNLKGRNHSECSICTVADFTVENLAVTSCGHYFHKKCLNDWKATGSLTCPECREQQN